MSPEAQDTLQVQLVDFLYHDVFNVIKPTEFIQEKATNVWLHEGRELLPDEVKGFKQEARMIQETKLWPLLLNELKYNAQERMYAKSKTPQDLVAGKIMLYIVSVIEERMKKM